MRPGNILFSGSFNAGKSTEFDDFENGTYKVPEIARMVLEGGTYGKSIAQVQKSGHYPIFQERVSLLHRQYEQAGHRDGGWVHDAGSVCAWAYAQDLEENTRKRISSILEKHLLACPPRKVLVFEPLRIKDDGVRHTSRELQQLIHKRIVDLCDGLQLDWALVPACGSDLRKKIIKEELKK